jgi:hypothetical protein
VLRDGLLANLHGLKADTKGMTRPISPPRHGKVMHISLRFPLLARSGRRALNRGNVVEDPLWDRIADCGNPGCQGQVATHRRPSMPKRISLKNEGETLANTVDVFLASAAPLARESGCPPNRVNPRKPLDARRGAAPLSAQRRQAGNRRRRQAQEKGRAKKEIRQNKTPPSLRLAGNCSGLLVVGART